MTTETPVQRKPRKPYGPRKPRMPVETTQEMHMVNAQVPAMNSLKPIPLVDPNFVPFGHYDLLEKIIVSKTFAPVYITGPSGNGKSTQVEQICAKNKRPMIRINFNNMTDEEQLIGTKTLINGNVEIVYGPVLNAMMNGYILLCDELDASQANAILCLQGILEGKPYYFKLENKVIYPAEGFNIIATGNTKGKGSDSGQYIGTNILNEAFLDRFAVMFEQDYPSARIEQKIITKLMTSLGCENEDFCSDLVKWADAIRRTYEAGGVDEVISTRRLSHIVKTYSIVNDTDMSVQLCCNRFDSTTSKAFIDLYQKIKTDQDIAQDVAQDAQDEGDAQ